MSRACEFYTAFDLLDIYGKQEDCRLNLYFISNILPMEVINRMKRCVAGAQFQVSLAESISNNIDGKLEMLSIVRSGNKEAAEWCDRIVFGDHRYTPIKHMPKPFLEEFFCGIQVFINGLRWARHNKGRKVLVLNAPNEVMTPLLLLKKCGYIDVYSILIDSPFTNKDQSSLYLRWKKRFAAKGLKKLNSSNGVILLNEHTADVLGLRVPHQTILLGFEPFDLRYTRGQYCGIRNRKKRLLYAGSLSRVNGIEEMLNALALLPEDAYTIDICGQGSEDCLVEDFARLHPNCCFHGRVEQDELNRLYEDADMMLNFRLPDDDDNDYSFPSKLISYLYSGSLVISSNFSSMPNAYRDFIFIVDNLRPETIANEIERIFTLDEETLNEMSARAREFVLKNQSWDQVAKEVVSFIEKN